MFKIVKKTKFSQTVAIGSILAIGLSQISIIINADPGQLFASVISNVSVYVPGLIKSQVVLAITVLDMIALGGHGATLHKCGFIVF